MSLSWHSRSGYPSYRVPTVAPGPTSGEVTNLQVGHNRDLVLSNLVASGAQWCALRESCPASSIHRVTCCLITFWRLADLWPPYPGVRLVMRITYGITVAGVNGTFTARAIPERIALARALHVRDGPDPTFSHFRLLLSLHDWQARAPLSWSGSQTLGAGVAWCVAEES